MSSSPVSMYTRNTGKSNGYGSSVSFAGDAEAKACCVFCGSPTALHRNRYVWHNCYGFMCPAVDKTPAQAKRIKLTASGAVIGEADDMADGDVADQEA